jgi:hypothetical protein
MNQRSRIEMVSFGYARRTAWIFIAGAFFSLSGPAAASVVGQVIYVAVWNAGNVGGSLDSFGVPTTPAGATGVLLVDGTWYPISGTNLEVKAESFGAVIAAGSAACNPSLSPDVLGDCEFVEFSVRTVLPGSLGDTAPAPTEQSAIVFEGIGAAGQVRNADVGAGQSNFYSYFTEGEVWVSGPTLSPYEVPDLLNPPRTSVPAVISTTDVSDIAPFGVELSTTNLLGVPLADYDTVFGLPSGWDGVTVGIAIESLAPPAVPSFRLPGLVLLVVAVAGLGVAASRRGRLVEG